MTWEEERQKEAKVTGELVGIAQKLGFDTKPVKSGRWVNGAVVIDPSSGDDVCTFWVGHTNERRRKLYVYIPTHGYETLHDARLNLRRILRVHREKRLSALDGLAAEIGESYESKTAYQSRKAARNELSELAIRLGFTTRLGNYFNPELEVLLGDENVATVIVREFNQVCRRRPIYLSLKKPGTFPIRDHYSLDAAKERLERHLRECLGLQADRLDSLATELDESTAQREIDRLVEGRDDIGKLNIPASGKRYARMKGLKSVTPPNKQNLYVKMVADLVNRGVTKGFKNRDAGEVQHV